MDVNGLLGLLLFIIGTITGSFLNVCIVRLPLEKSVVFPGLIVWLAARPLRGMIIFL